MSCASIRQDIWRAIRRLSAQGRPFDVPLLRGQLRGAVRHERVRDYCRALQAGGYLDPALMEDGSTVWTLARDPGDEAPRVRDDGQPVIQGAGTGQMWAALRVLRTFGVDELVATASTDRWTVSRATAADYCQRLARAGFLRRLGNGVYAAVPTRCNGPRAVQIRRDKTLHDPNTGQDYSATGELLTQGGRHG